MKIYTFTHLRDFPFWGGAQENASLLTPDDFNIVEEECFSSDEVYDEFAINSFFWFDFEQVAWALGYKDEADLIEHVRAKRQEEAKQRREEREALRRSYYQKHGITVS